MRLAKGSFTPHRVALLTVLCFGLLLSPAAGAAERTLTIDEAVRLALEADIDYQIALLTWENAEIDDRIARAQGDMTPYEQLQHELTLRRAQNTFSQAQNNLILSVISDYIGLIQAAQQLEIRERQLSLAEAELHRTEQMIQIGNATEQDRLRQTNQVVNAQLSAEAARRTFETRRSSFLERLGLSEDVQLILDDALPVRPFIYTLDEALDRAREASFEVWERQVNLRLAEMDLESLRSQSPAPLALKKAENNFRIQQLNAQKAKAQFATQFTNQFHTVADSWKQLENAERDYRIALDSYNQTLRQYEAGLKTEQEMAQAEIDRLSAEQSIVDARNNYATQLLELDIALGLPLPYGEGEQS